MIALLANLSPETAFTAPIAVACSFIAALIIVTWRVANMLRDVRDELKQLSVDMAETWSLRKMERWSAELERRNRNLPLIVPDTDLDRA